MLPSKVDIIDASLKVTIPESAIKVPEFSHEPPIVKEDVAEASNEAPAEFEKFPDTAIVGSLVSAVVVTE